MEQCSFYFGACLTVTLGKTKEVVNIDVPVSDGALILDDVQRVSRYRGCGRRGS